jgi:predicted metal-dependent TIM-barrel fold hydrolase
MQKVITSGHISPTETFKMVDFAQGIGISKILITHVSADDAMEETLSLAQQQRLAEKGVFMEHCLIMLLPVDGRLDPKELVKAIKTVGAEHCIISSDLGQARYCPPAEGMRMFMGILLRAGLSEEEINLMAKVNPAQLLGLS